MTCEHHKRCGDCYSPDVVNQMRRDAALGAAAREWRCPNCRFPIDYAEPCHAHDYYFSGAMISALRCAPPEAER